VDCNGLFLLEDNLDVLRYVAQVPVIHSQCASIGQPLS
jgi:hypothetical protein